MCYDFEQDRNNIMVGWDGRAWSRLNALETIESNGNTITVQDFTSGEQVEALIEKVTFDRISPPDRRFQGFGGIIYVQVRTT
jgi:ribosomal protein L21E